MKSGYAFSAGDRINAAVPKLHIRLMRVAQATLRPGDFIEIGIERKPAEDGDSPHLVESVFARVEAIHWPFVDATVHSKPRFTNHHGVRAGDTISCSDEQILCYLPDKYPKTKGWIEFVTEKVLEMQRAFLATLILNELPQDCFTKCVLDKDTTVLIRPMGGEFMGVLVGVNVAKSSDSDMSPAPFTTNAAHFHEAAGRLGFISHLPGQIISTARNQLTLSFEPSASGQQLINSVFESVDAVRQEMTHVVAEQAAKMEQP